MQHRFGTVIVLITWWCSALLLEQTTGFSEAPNSTTVQPISNGTTTIKNQTSVANTTTVNYQTPASNVSTISSLYISTVSTNITKSPDNQQTITVNGGFTKNISTDSSTTKNIFSTRLVDKGTLTTLNSTVEEINLNETSTISTLFGTNFTSSLGDLVVNISKTISETTITLLETMKTSATENSTLPEVFPESITTPEKENKPLSETYPELIKTTSVNKIQTTLPTTTGAPMTTTADPCVNPSNMFIRLEWNVSANSRATIKATVGDTRINVWTYPTSAIVSVNMSTTKPSSSEIQYYREDTITLNTSENLEEQAMLCSTLNNFTWFIDARDHFHIQCTVNNTNFTKNEYLLFGSGDNVYQGAPKFPFFGTNKGKSVRIANHFGHIFFKFLQNKLTVNERDKVLFLVTCYAKRVSFESKNVTKPVSFIPSPTKKDRIHLCLVNLDQNKTKEFVQIHSPFRQEFVKLIENRTLEFPQLKLDTSDVIVSVMINHTLTIHSPFRDQPCKYSTDPEKPYCVCFYLGIVITNTTTNKGTSLNEEQLQLLFNQIIDSGSFLRYRIRFGDRKPNYFLVIGIPTALVGLSIIIFYVVWRTADWKFWNSNEDEEKEPSSWRLRVQSLTTENPVYDDDYLVKGWHENQFLPNGGPFGLDANEIDSSVKNSPQKNKTSQIKCLQSLRINPQIQNDENQEKSPGTPTPSPKILPSPKKSSMKKPSPDVSPSSPKVNKDLKLILPKPMSPTPLTPPLPPRNPKGFPLPPIRTHKPLPPSPLTLSPNLGEGSPTTARRYPLTPTVTPLRPILNQKRLSWAPSPSPSPEGSTKSPLQFPLSSMVANQNDPFPLTPIPTQKAFLHSSASPSPTEGFLHSPTSPSRVIRFSLVPRDSTIIEEDEDTDL